MKHNNNNEPEASCHKDAGWIFVITIRLPPSYACYSPTTAKLTAVLHSPSVVGMVGLALVGKWESGPKGVGHLRDVLGRSVGWSLR